MWVLIVVVMISGLVGCSAGEHIDSSAIAAGQDLTKANEKVDNSSGLLAVDTNTSACANFYNHSCGPWRKHNPLKSGEPIHTRWVAAVNRINNQRVASIIDGQSGGGFKHQEQLLRSYYEQCLDVRSMDREGIEPLRPLLKKISDLVTLNQFMGLVGELQTIGVPALVLAYVLPDPEKGDFDRFYVLPQSLALGRAELYAAPADELVAKYRTYIKAMFVGIGLSRGEADSTVERVFDFEAKLALQQVHDSPSGSAQKLWPQKQFVSQFSSLPWMEFLRAVGLDDQGVVVPDASKLRVLSELIQQTDLKTLQDYLTWQVLNALGDKLSAPLRSAHFEFVGKQRQGLSEPPARSSMCMQATRNSFQDAIGEIYMSKYFDAGVTEQASILAEQIRQSFIENLDTVVWLDEETRMAASDKARRLEVLLGGPTIWADYQSLQSGSGWFQTDARATRYAFSQQISRVDKKVDQGRWSVPVFDANAGYDATQNAIFVPLGVLQPPLFDANQPTASNYGGIGTIIAHEFTHGFDENGANYDAEGNRSDWWSAAARKEFGDRVQCVVDLYDSYEVLPGVHIKGRQTSNENIADMGGLKFAYQSFRRALGAQSNLDEDRDFFVAYGQNYCTNSTDANTRVYVEGNVHAFPEYRVVGPAATLQDFASAFRCQADTQLMSPPNRCAVW